MKKKFNLLSAIVLAVTMLVSMVPCAGAVEQKTVDPEKDKGSVTITAEYGGRKLKDLQITLYRVGKGKLEGHNLQFDLMDQLMPEADSAEKPIELNGLKGSETKKAAADLLKKI